MIKSFLLRIACKLASIGLFELSIFGTLAIAVNLVFITPSSRSSANIFAEGLHVDLSMIGMVILLGVFLTAITESLLLRFIGKLPYWIFTIGTMIVTIQHQLPSLGFTLYAIPAAGLLIHWLRGLLTKYGYLQPNVSRQ